MSDADAIVMTEGAALSVVVPWSVFAQEQVQIEYDALGRLKKVTHENGPSSGTVSTYAYDLASNRTNVTVAGAQKRVVVVPLNGFTIIPLN